MVFLLLLIPTTLLVLTVRLAVQTERQFAEPSSPLPHRRAVQRLGCRILFVERSVLTDEVVVDCVVVDSEHLPAGTPFSLTVADLGTGWFGDIAEGMLRRWADEDTVVSLDVAEERAHSRVEARDKSSRVRLDVRRRVGLG
jgi:hypothetical protein